MYTRDVIGYLNVCGFALAEKCLPSLPQAGTVAGKSHAFFTSMRGWLLRAALHSATEARTVALSFPWPEI